MFTKDRSSRRKVLGFFFFSPSKPEWREVGTKFTIGPCILCVLLDLAVQWKWPLTPQVARRNKVTKVCETPDAPASSKSATWKHFVFPLCQEGRKSYRQTQNNMQTLPDHNSYSPYSTFFTHLCTISHHGVDTEVLSYNEILISSHL